MVFKITENLSNTNLKYAKKNFLFNHVGRLFNLNQWKQMCEDEYVLGIEPCNCYVGGRDPRNVDNPVYLKPGKSKNFDVEIELVSGSNAIQDLEQKINLFNV